MADSTDAGPFFEGEWVPPEYTQLVQPHVDSFDYFCGEGMELAANCMEPMEVRDAACWTC